MPLRVEFGHGNRGAPRGPKRQMDGAYHIADRSMPVALKCFHRLSRRFRRLKPMAQSIGDEKGTIRPCPGVAAHLFARI